MNAEDKPAKIEQVESIDLLLERLAQWNAAGRIRGLAVVFIDDEGLSNCHWSKWPSFLRLLGALQWLQFQIMAED